MKLTPWMLSVATFGMIALLVVGYFVKLAFSGPEVQEVARRTTRTLPMALAEIPPGTLVTRAHVGNGPWKLDSGELAPDTLTRVDSLIGRITKVKIEPATPIESSMFYPPGDFPDLQVDEGKRAVVVGISPTTAPITAILKDGQYVDVQLTVDSVNVTSAGARRNASPNSVPQHLGDAMTATLFRGVKVLGIAGGGQAVTLELDEEQSRVALLAQKKGEIDLVYSSSQNPQPGGIRIATSEQDRIYFEEILGLRPGAPRQDNVFKTEQYRGTNYSDSYFEDGKRIGNDMGQGAPQTAPLDQRRQNVDNSSPATGDLAEVFDDTATRR